MTWHDPYMSNGSTKVECGKCDGKGRLPWTANAGGRCFACGGSGSLLVDESEIEVRRLPRARVISDINTALEQLKASEKSMGAPDLHETYYLGYALASADADVHARAYAALGRILNEVGLWHVKRDERLARAELAQGSRKVYRNVRKA